MVNVGRTWHGFMSPNKRLCSGDRKVWRHVAIGRVIMLVFAAALFGAVGLDISVWRQNNEVSWALGIVLGLFALALGLNRLRWQKPVLYESVVVPDMKSWSHVFRPGTYLVPKGEIVNLRVLRAQEVRGTHGWRPDRPAKVELLLRDGSKVYLDAVDCGKEMMDHFLAYEKQWDYVARLNAFPPLRDLKSRKWEPE